MALRSAAALAGRLLRPVARVLTAALVADALATALFVHLGYQSLQEHTSAGSFDAAVVFFSGHPDTDHLDDDDVRHLEHAAHLFRVGAARHIVCVGGSRSWTERVGARMMRDFLLRAGLPAARVLHDSTSFDSRSNWREARRIIRAHQWTRIALVSTPLHLLRLLELAADETMDISVAVLPRYQRRGLGMLLPLWVAAHREALAWLAMAVLRADTYREALRWLRNARVI